MSQTETKKDIGINFKNLSADELVTIQNIYSEMDKQLPAIINDRISFSANLTNVILASTIMYICLLNALKKSDGIVVTNMFKLGKSNIAENTNIGLLWGVFFVSFVVSIWVIFEHKQTTNIADIREKQYISGGVGAFTGFVFFICFIYMIVLNLDVKALLDYSSNWERVTCFSTRYSIYFIVFFLIMVYFGLNVISMIELKVKSSKEFDDL